MVARHQAAMLLLATCGGVGALMLACGEAPTGHQRGAVLLRFSTSASAVASPPPRPFTGILDSLDVVVRSAGVTTTHFGMHLTAADTGLITHSLGVVEGRISIVAHILSTNGTLLHVGTRDVDVTKAGGAIDVVLQPDTAIMLASPDTLRANALSSQAVNDSFKVYNRGIGSLSWNLSGINPPVPAIRNCAINCLRPRDTIGVVVAGDSMFVHIDSIYIVAGPVRFTLSSPQGSLTVVVMRR